MEIPRHLVLSEMADEGLPTSQDEALGRIHRASPHTPKPIARIRAAVAHWLIEALNEGDLSDDQRPGYKDALRGMVDHDDGLDTLIEEAQEAPNA